MSLCLIAALSPAARQRAVRAVAVKFDRIATAGFGDLLTTAVRERPDVVVLVAESDPRDGSDAAWVTAVTELRAAAPNLAVLITATPQIGRDAEPRLAAAALAHGARGYLHAHRETGPLPRPPASTRLTHRELQILRGMTDGLTNGDIAAELYLSADTVKTHARRLFRKLGATDRAHAVAHGFRQGLLR